MVKTYYQIQRGRGRYYKIQRGRGFGNFLRSIFKITAPIVKKIASNNTVKKIGKELVNRGLESAKDVIKGEPIKKVVNREKKYLKDKSIKVIEKVAKKINKNENDDKTKNKKINTKKKNNKKKTNKKSSPYLF